MIILIEPNRLTSGFTPCHCNGNCPYGLYGNCPASTASGFISIEPLSGKPQLDEDELIALREYDELRRPRAYRWWDIPAMRPEDV